MLFHQVGGQPGAVLDAVDPGLDQVGQGPRRRSSARSPGRPAAWAAPGSPRRSASGGASRGRGRRRRGAIQSPTIFTQPSPALRLLRHARRQLLRLDLVRVVADVAAGAGDVPTRADHPRQVVAVVDPGGVGRAEPQSRISSAPAVAVVDRLLLGRLVAGRAGVVEPEVAVRVDDSGTIQPSADRLGPRLRLVGDQPVDDVHVARLTVRKDRARNRYYRHGADAIASGPPTRPGH